MILNIASPVCSTSFFWVYKHKKSAPGEKNLLEPTYSHIGGTFNFLDAVAVVIVDAGIVGSVGVYSIFRDVVGGNHNLVTLGVVKVVPMSPVKTNLLAGAQLIAEGHHKGVGVNTSNLDFG